MGGVLEQLDHSQLRAAVVAFRDALRAHQQRLNRLNVYPVPDGDTGTNMALTLESVVDALDQAPDGDGGGGMEATCRAVSHGSLMGARGNSGVILSQVLRGLCRSLDGAEAVDGHTFARALAEASTAAYGAVMRPVEGTILTVVREASEAAVAAGERPLVEVLDEAARSAREALARTPELLPVLAEAGVVDAGGAGFVLFLDALLHVVDGRPLPPPPQDEPGPEAGRATPPEAGRVTPPEAGRVTAPEGEPVAMDGPRYEVMFLLEAPDDAIEGFKGAWSGMGDSIVVVGGDGLWNCHIHSDDIGASIEAALDVGRPRRIQVTDLAEQVEEERWVRQGMAGGEAEAAPGPVATGVVAVAMGDAVREAFESLGAQRVVAGGQTMNPSTAELLDAVEGLRADEVVVLPNNRNVVPVAREAAAMASKPVVVVPTPGIVEGLAAMLAYDPSAGGQDNRKAMEDAAAGVVSGQVTWAVRDSGSISRGDWLGLADGEVVVCDPDLVRCATGLLDRLVGPDHELVTVLVGESAHEEATDAVVRWLEANREEVSVEVQPWRVPLSAYLFSIE